MSPNNSISRPRPMCAPPLKRRVVWFLALLRLSILLRLAGQNQPSHWLVIYRFRQRKLAVGPRLPVPLPGNLKCGKSGTRKSGFTLLRGHDGLCRERHG